MCLQLPGKTILLNTDDFSSISFLWIYPTNLKLAFYRIGRTADHVFTLRTLIDKYVHNHNEKSYACFVDFEKAFDSVWHDGLLNKPLQIDVGGSLYNLIKSLYHNSSCSIRIGQNKRDNSVMRELCGKAVS